MTLLDRYSVYVYMYRLFAATARRLTALCLRVWGL